MYNGGILDTYLFSPKYSWHSLVYRMENVLDFDQLLYRKTIKYQGLPGASPPDPKQGFHLVLLGVLQWLVFVSLSTSCPGSSPAQYYWSRFLLWPKPCGPFSNKMIRIFASHTSLRIFSSYHGTCVYDNNKKFWSTFDLYP